MKTLIVLLTSLALAVKIKAYLIKIPTSTTTRPNTAPGGWVHLQKLVLPLFENVCDVSSDPLIVALAQEFSTDVPNGDYLKPDVILNLQKLITEKGLLGNSEIFSEYNITHLNELQTIYEVLYYAKNFDIFYKAAAWARQNLNCQLYVAAIYMATQNRRDTERLSIPGPYELLPNYFIQKDVIIQASYLSAGENITSSGVVHIEGNTYILDANYTASFYDNDEESKLAYFREDIGLNSYYFLRKLKLAPWINAHPNERYGENLYQMMKQFMTRYNLERYSNGLPELDSLSWDSLSDVPYNPMLIYANGNEFIHRTLPIELPDREDVALLQTIENNIETVVGHMMQAGYNKTQILNHLMEILVTGDRSYETLARLLLGKDCTYNGYPSVLEHYMTSLRDPIFWKINKKVVDLVDNALKLVPPYARNELYFPGVEVVNVEMTKIMTAFDYFKFDVTDALKIAGDNTTFQIQVGQPRLNHKPFSIKINIASLVSQKGLVKIYLGPKMLPGEFAKNKNLFMLLDSFEVNLKTGANLISRTSDDMTQFSDDFLCLETLRKKVEDAEFGLDSLPFKTVESQMGYPSRLIIPKGSSQGLPLQLFLFIAPFSKKVVDGYYTSSSMELNTAILSPGYPLDLVIEDKELFGLPNAMLKDVLVTHKGDNKVGNYGGSSATKKSYASGPYDPSSPPNYPNEKEPFDYSSKKDKYGKKEDYPSNSYTNVVEDDVNSFDQNKYNIADIAADVPYRNLATSGYNYPKRKISFGYKSNKQSNEKKIDNYSTNNDNSEVEIAEHQTVVVDSNKNDVNTTEKVLIINLRNKNDSVSDLNIPQDQNDNKYYESYSVEPVLEQVEPKKRFTVYDYIIHVHDNDDSSEEKVYE